MAETSPAEQTVEFTPEEEAQLRRWIGADDGRYPYEYGWLAKAVEQYLDARDAGIDDVDDLRAALTDSRARVVARYAAPHAPTGSERVF